MKFTLTFKTPDVLEQLEDSACDLAMAAADDDADPDDEEIQEATAEHQDTMRAFAKQWVKYDECITVEFDTEAKTATVMKVK